MPAKCMQGMRRDALFKCFPEEIEVRPELNGRHDKPDVEWLIQDIMINGQMQPVGVWPDGDTPVLAYGFSRWRAISEINKRKLVPNKLEIKCTFVKCNEQGAFIRNISENRQRNPTTPIDDAHNIARLIESWQMDLKEVAKIYFPLAATVQELAEAIKFVNGRLELIKLTPEAERAMREGRLSETAAQAIAKLTSSQQREALKSKEGKLTAKDVKSVKPSNKKPKKIKIDGELKRRITAVIETADWEAFDEDKNLRIEVQADALAALKNYLETIG